MCLGFVLECTVMLKILDKLIEVFLKDNLDKEKRNQFSRGYYRAFCYWSIEFSRRT